MICGIKDIMFGLFEHPIHYSLDVIYTKFAIAMLGFMIYSLFEYVEFALILSYLV